MLLYALYWHRKIIRKCEILALITSFNFYSLACWSDLHKLSYFLFSRDFSVLSPLCNRLQYHFRNFVCDFRICPFKLWDPSKYSSEFSRKMADYAADFRSPQSGQPSIRAVSFDGTLESCSKLEGRGPCTAVKRNVKRYVASESNATSLRNDRGIGLISSDRVRLRNGK